MNFIKKVHPIFLQEIKSMQAKLFLMLILSSPLWANIDGHYHKGWKPKQSNIKPGAPYNDQMWDASYYAEHITKTFHAVVDNVISQLQLTGNEKILDVGCGDGRISEQLAKKVPKGSVVGIDYSHDMIKFARKTYNNVYNLTFYTVDVAKLDFKPEFDVVVSFMSLHWVPDHENALNRMAASLKPGGLLVIMQSDNRHHPFYASVDETARSKRWKDKYPNTNRPPWYPEDPASYKELLSEAGFKTMHVSSNGCSLQFNGKQGLCDWLKGWITAVPYVYQLDTNLWDPFIEDVADCYIAKINANEKNSVPYDVNYVLVFAKKKKE